MADRNYRTTPLSEENWIKSKKYKPDDDDLCLVLDMENEYELAQWDSEDRLWLDREMNVIADVVYWMRIPDVEG